MLHYKNLNTDLLCSVYLLSILVKRFSQVSWNKVTYFLIHQHNVKALGQFSSSFKWFVFNSQLSERHDLFQGWTLTYRNINIIKCLKKTKYLSNICDVLAFQKFLVVLSSRFMINFPSLFQIFDN